MNVNDIHTVHVFTINISSKKYTIYDIHQLLHVLAPTYLVHNVAQYYTLRTAYLEKIFSDNMELRPIFVYILYVYKKIKKWQLWRLILEI